MTPPALAVTTLGRFAVVRAGVPVEAQAWTREKAVALFHFFLAERRRAWHKEQLIEQLWPQQDAATGARDFKVALNALAKTLEPERPPRTASRYIERSGATYRLRTEALWIDADAFEAAVRAGHQALGPDPAQARVHYAEAEALYQGPFLPGRPFDDWAGAERERLQTMALTALTTLADLWLPERPREALRVASEVVRLEPTWEAAYRTQMRAQVALGNRPLALRAYERCADALARVYDTDPLPQTQALYVEIQRP
ncbi:MAG: bacterial transcriptional activator domain-containing protein [Bacteroidota bacterium]